MGKKRKTKRVPSKQEVIEYAILRFAYQLISDAVVPDAQQHTHGSRELHALMRKLYIVLSIHERSMGELARRRIEQAVKGMDETSREQEVITAVAGISLLDMYRHSFSPKSPKFKGIFNGADIEAIVNELLPNVDNRMGREQTDSAIAMAEKFYNRITKLQ